jgi:prepilin-type processing-associated H-X9-DG protein
MTRQNRLQTLSKEDARVLDALVENGGLDRDDIEGLEGDDRERGKKIAGLLALLDAYPVEDASDELVNATIARVNRSEDARSERMNLQASRELNDQLSGKRWRFPDLFATAAMLLLTVGVIWPVVNHARQSRMIALDHDNLSESHEGITSYAAGNNGMTPMQSVAGLLPDPFDWMGSHAGLHNQMIRETCGDRLQQNDFHNPGGSLEQHPYSFQVWQEGQDLLTAEQPIASNTNPLPAMASSMIPMREADARTNTLDHDGLGQNVLFGDGHVQMVEISEINGDRIWDPGTSSQGQIIAILRGEIDGDVSIFLIH